GISLQGKDFLFGDNVTTTNGGALTINNSGTVTMTVGKAFNLDGPFLQSGMGGVEAVGTLTTNNQTVDFEGSLLLIGNFTITTGGGDVTIQSDVEGSHSLSINAGAGDVTFVSSVSLATPLQSLTITGSDISLNGIGTISLGVTGPLVLNASNNLNLSNANYTALSQDYTAGTMINLNNGALMRFTATGAITFHSPVLLTPQSDISVTTNGGNFTYASFTGSDFENITIDTGTGTAFMETIDGPGKINNVMVQGGQIRFVGPIEAVNTDFVATGYILNQAGQVAINSLNTASFNALHGDVGTLASPILVNTSNQIFAGADSSTASLASFDGTSIDNTVQIILSNPPCKIVFNGVVIKDCSVPPPPPPSPPAPPGPPPSPTLLFPFAVPGFDSSSFNLGSYYFFLLYFFDETYLDRPYLIYY
ncbi:MAG: hypothetical protein JSR76_03380, partial [Verrucomicrobia bacterium]|nr:hypothetical protein [Verrucomicrobiota bacterium]